jgi:hypothetical protein
MMAYQEFKHFIRKLADEMDDKESWAGEMAWLLIVHVGRNKPLQEKLLMTELPEAEAFVKEVTGYHWDNGDLEAAEEHCLAIHEGLRGYNAHYEAWWKQQLKRYQHGVDCKICECAACCIGMCNLDH